MRYLRFTLCKSRQKFHNVFNVLERYINFFAKKFDKNIMLFIDNCH